jgi:hypothetical protein
MSENLEPQRTQRHTEEHNSKIKAGVKAKAKTTATPVYRLFSVALAGQGWAEAHFCTEFSKKGLDQQLPLKYR